MKILVNESGWSGKNRNYKPKIVKHEYDVVLNKKYIIKSRKINRFKNFKFFKKNLELFSFVIKEISTDYIVIVTNQDMSIMEDNSFSLRDYKTEFKIILNETLEIVTPSTDCGDIYTFTLKQ